MVRKVNLCRRVATPAWFCLGRAACAAQAARLASELTSIQVKVPFRRSSAGLFCIVKTSTESH